MVFNTTAASLDVVSDPNAICGDVQPRDANNVWVAPCAYPATSSQLFALWRLCK